MGERAFVEGWGAYTSPSQTVPTHDTGLSTPSPRAQRFTWIPRGPIRGQGQARDANGHSAIFGDPPSATLFSFSPFATHHPLPLRERARGTGTAGPANLPTSIN